MQENILKLIQSGQLKIPHEILGLQKGSDTGAVIRLWRPNTQSCRLEVRGKVVEAEQVDLSGLYEYPLPEEIAPTEYKVFDATGRAFYDPYVFPNIFGELDVHLVTRGLHYNLYNLLGATVKTHEEVKGVNFAVWAPNARCISLVGPFNNWEPTTLPMRLIEGTGVWELFVPGLEEDTAYQYVVFMQDGEKKIKTDPVCHYFSLRPSKESRVFDVDRYKWNDASWIENRGKFRNENWPMQIYEVHLGSWKRKEEAFLGYREMAHDLAAYCKKLHFTHVELIGIAEHPLDESWGYQVTGYFAPTSRHGSPEDFQYLVDHLHQQGIGVILDWVPGHFPTDEHSLAKFDGTYLYEHMDPRQGYHPEWNTHIFNYGRFEVSNFLIASALFWLEKMHVDGLRIDAVASMLFLDFAREDGEWIPNTEGTNLNYEAIEFLKHLNSVIHELHPTALSIAEESHAFGGVTTPLHKGGLGFDYSWNLGWMNDTLSFFSRPFAERKRHFSSFIRIFTYLFDERYIHVLSHDEVVHLKKSLLSKMPGTSGEKFAGLRLLLSFMVALPGKSLLFMGGELGQESEWNCTSELPWSLLLKEEHSRLQAMVASLNEMAATELPLYWGDSSPENLTMALEPDADHLVIAYLRHSVARTVLCIHSLGAEKLLSYWIPIENIQGAHLLFNTDSGEWGGCDTIPGETIDQGEGLTLEIPPLSTLIYEVDFAGEKE